MRASLAQIRSAAGPNLDTLGQNAVVMPGHHDEQAGDHDTAGLEVEVMTESAAVQGPGLRTSG